MTFQMSQRSHSEVEAIIKSYNDKNQLMAWARYHDQLQHPSVVSRLVEIESGMDYTLSDDDWRKILSCMTSVQELDNYVGTMNDPAIDERRTQLQAAQKLFSNKKVSIDYNSFKRFNVCIIFCFHDRVTSS